MIAVRGINSKDWPCPWITIDLKGCTSYPQEWDLILAKEYVDKHSSVAVYSVRGFYQKLIYPINHKEK